MAKDKQKNLTNRKQDQWASSEPSMPTTVSPGYPNTPEKQDSDLKSYLMMLVEDFKKGINNSLKGIQENTNTHMYTYIHTCTHTIHNGFLIVSHPTHRQHMSLCLSCSIISYHIISYHIIFPLLYLYCHHYCDEITLFLDSVVIP
jgi:hypothetical protein